MREVQDHYFREAKREGYLSRAAYKLIEIDDRKKVLRAGDRVLDCGAAPGSWLQVVGRRVGPKGMVIGVDLQPMKPIPNQSNIRTVQGDLTEMELEELMRLAAAIGGDEGAVKPFDVVLSDMAPATTGDPFGDHHRSVRLCDALLVRCARLLRTGGKLVMKVFEGEAYPDLVKRIEAQFEKTRGFKPKASRGESREMYIVAEGYHGAGKGRPPESSPTFTPSTPQARKKPPSGWKIS